MTQDWVSSSTIRCLEWHGKIAGRGKGKQSRSSRRIDLLMEALTLDLWIELGREVIEVFWDGLKGRDVMVMGMGMEERREVAGGGSSTRSRK